MNVFDFTSNVTKRGKNQYVFKADIHEREGLSNSFILPPPAKNMPATGLVTN